MAKNFSITDLQRRIAKLNERLGLAATVLEDDNRTKRQITINIQHLERIVEGIEGYSAWEIPKEEKFDYNTLTQDLLDTAQECLIELNGYLQELEETSIMNLSKVPAELLTESPRTTVQSGPCNIRLTIPKFRGDYSEYPRFKSAFSTAMETDRKSKAAQLRVLEQHLEDRPLVLIRNLPPTDDGFDQAMRILDETFNVGERQKQSILKKIKSLPQATEDLASIRSNYEELEALLRALQSHEEINNNEELRRLVMSKYSLSTLDRVSPTEIPTLQLLRDRVKQIVRAKEDICSVFDSLSVSAPASQSIPVAAVMQADSKSPRFTANRSSHSQVAKSALKPKEIGIRCVFCNRPHSSQDCRTYSNAVQRVRKLPPSTCYKCLEANNHLRKDCPKSTKCAICACEWHHVALCPKKYGYFREQVPRERQSDTTATAENQLTVKQTSPDTSEIPKTIVGMIDSLDSCYLTARTRIRNPITGNTMIIRAFLDCGCNKTFVLVRTARELKLSPFDASKLLVGVFMRPELEEIQTDVVKLEILHPDTDEPYAIQAHTVPRISDTIVTRNAHKLKSTFPQISSFNLADEANNEEICLLIGNNFLWKFIKPESKIELTENLFLLNTLFGWMVVGCHDEELQGTTNFVTSMHVSTKIVNALWSLDTIGIIDKNYTKTEEEELALTQFNATIKHVPEERRYEVGLPSRELYPEIPTNYNLAKAILLSLLRKYDKKPAYLRACSSIFEQQLKSGIIEEAPTPHHDRTHYLPYHFVERERKSTPIRVVYNASAKTAKNNQSLNETLYKGVNLLQDLIGIFIRFRLYVIAIIADIEKAFHQISLLPEYRDYVRFIWKKEPENKNSSEFVTFRFRRIPFGVISSPFILAATILYHLNRYKCATAKRARRDIYADNIITSFCNESDASEFYREAIEIFDEAGMPLRQWHSNSEHLRNEIPDDHRDQKETVTVLGLLWNTTTDRLSLNLPQKPITDEGVTMLQVLQISSRIYDPMGFFTPVTINSRIFLQQLHAKGYEWNTVLNKEEHDEWTALVDDLFALSDFEFVRSFSVPENTENSLQLHIFSDASIKAYAAAAYLRVHTSDRTTTHLLISKSRVTPLHENNRLTIPRLELMAALLGSRLMTKISDAFKDEPAIQKFHWIDSKCVLAWLQTNAALPTFVKNRVREIKCSPDVSYCYVPSADNPADLASRGVSVNNLHNNETIWWHGPNWLKDDPEHWPTSDRIFREDEPIYELTVDPVMMVPEIKRENTPFTIKHEKYVDYGKLIRVTAIAVQFLRSFAVIKRKGLFPDSKTATVDIAKFMWIRYVQRSEFALIIETLALKNTSNIIKKLKLFTDDQNIIRLRGRFQLAPLSFEEKFPILLPKPTTDHFTKLLVLHIHRKNLHAGVNTTLSTIRREFWILQGRKQVSAIIRQCNACKREKSTSYKQPFDSILPRIRLDNTSEPFSHVGLDVAGHFWVRTTKKWILLVTCLVTRAVILEDLDNMETSMFLSAINRAETYTSGIKTYLSDNATQFHSVQSVLQSQNTEPIEWKFTGAYMPWEGAAYERLMKSMKSALYATFREVVNISEIQFRTIIKQIATVMNNRPLTFMGEEFDGRPLTPNDFLRRKFVAEETTVELLRNDSATASFLKHQLKQTNEIISHFWRNWSHEYLQFLRERYEKNKFRQQTYPNEPRIGDVVLLHDAVQKRRNWHLGIIIQKHPSDDNQVRSAVVKLGTGTKVVRPVEKLYYLGLNEFRDQGLPVPTEDHGSSPTGIENIVIDP